MFAGQVAGQTTIPRMHFTAVYITITRRELSVDHSVYGPQSIFQEIQVQHENAALN